MSDEKSLYTRRDFLKIVGVSASGAALCINGVFAMDKPGGPDLTLENYIQAGRKVPLRASTSYLDMVSLKLKPKAQRTRMLVSFRFTSESVLGAKFSMTLYNKSGKVVGETTHIEYLGEREIRSRYPKGDKIVRRWNDTRNVWLTLPGNARKAARFKLEIEAVN